jgi:hypothetical protein
LYYESYPRPISGTSQEEWNRKDYSNWESKQVKGSRGKYPPVIARIEEKTEAEKYAEISIGSTLEALRSIGSRPNWSAFDNFLLKKCPFIHAQFSQSDKDGFKSVGKRPFEVWLQAVSKSKASTSNQTIQQIVAQAN